MTRVPVGRMPAMNRIVWNDISDAWQRRRESDRDWRFFRRGGSHFPARIHRLMGPVRGRTLLDMACGSGEGALSWTNRGARCTGVDISDRRLAEARKKAALAGRRITYVRGSVIRLPFKDRSFDRVYTGGGISAWIPDTKRWAREIARVLKPGGRFLFHCRHPFDRCLYGTSGPDGVPQLTRRAGGYFDTRPLTYHGMTAWMNRPRMLPHVERNWPLADLLNPLIAAGLRPVRFLETPVGRTYNGKPLPRGHHGAFPSGLSMAWDKPR